MQKVVKSRHGEFEVQGDAKEIEVLRQRVVELEKERDRVSITLPCFFWNLAIVMILFVCIPLIFKNRSLCYSVMCTLNSI